MHCHGPLNNDIPAKILFLLRCFLMLSYLLLPVRILSVIS